MLLGSRSSHVFILLVVPILLLLLLLLLQHASSADAGLRSDGQALLLFLAGASGGSGNVNLNWSASRSPCEWTGVKCSGGGGKKTNRVVSLQLPGSGLSGIIPNGTLGSLPHLQSISLGGNRLSGPIPSDILRCIALRKLVLRHNLLNSSIPSFSPSSSPFLSLLDLSFNRLLGPIPPSLARFPRLKSLLLHNNNLSGIIPPFAAVHELNVSHNRLSGPIPPSLAAKFHASSFAGNADLCGKPLPRVCLTEEHRRKRLDVKRIAGGAGALVLLTTLGSLIYSLRMGRPKRQAAEISKSSSSSSSVSKLGAAGVGSGDVEEQTNNKLVLSHHGDTKFLIKLLWKVIGMKFNLIKSKVIQILMG